MQVGNSENQRTAVASVTLDGLNSYSRGGAAAETSQIRDDKRRALRRRQQKARAVERARRFMATWGPYWYATTRSKPHAVKLFAKTPKLCSCYACCNRRKLEGPSISELRRGLAA